MLVTTEEANTKGLPESFEGIKRAIIKHDDLELEVCATEHGIVIRGIMNSGSAIIVCPQSANAILIKKGV